jgi:5-oxoprolinase (ATP-hydrolysing)
MKRVYTSSTWKLCIDTGGTFTDCIAERPDGRIIRKKILSSSAIRGTAQISGSGKQISLNTDDNFPDNFFRGYRFRLLSRPEMGFTIHGFNRQHSAIASGNTETELPAGEHPFEIISPEEAPVFAARLITKTRLDERLPPVQMRLATTKGTNALLERRGGKTLFLITEGFKDLLHIRTQQRPELFSLNIRKPLPYYTHIIEVPERVDAEGNVLKPLNTALLGKKIEALNGDFDSAGICLMHGYLNPEHEKKIESLLREMGVRRISRSSALSPTIKIVPRAITTDVNAFLSPVMDNYLERISEILEGNTLRVMTSAGSLAGSGSYTPKDGLLSGPAGGVIGAVAVAKRALESTDPPDFSQQESQHLDDETDSSAKNPPDLIKKLQIISFDMGGTSTDVARYGGAIETIFEHNVGDATLSAPAVDIETVAAGGGSVCGFDGISLTVGPESAGADPGPACYGRGGPLTITDVNLLSGRLHPSNFHISILPEAAEAAFQKVLEKINRSRSSGPGRSEILEGFLDIANERMAQAIRKISIQKGFDPSEHTMVAFGGAGAQHALAVAAKLKMNRVLVPSDAGLLSAYGLQQATLEQFATRQVLKPLSETEENIPSILNSLEDEARAGLEQQSVDPGKIGITSIQLFLRLKGQDTSLGIDVQDGMDIRSVFRSEYESHYGHWIEDREIELEAVRVKASEVIAAGNQESMGQTVSATGQRPVPGTRHGTESKLDSSDSFRIYSSDDFTAGAELDGPSLILNPWSTTVIEPGWQGRLLDDGTWLLTNPSDLYESSTRDSSNEEELTGGNPTGFTGNPDSSDPADLHSQKHKSASGARTTGKENPTDLEAVNLQLYTNRFRSVADQMGEMLRRTAISVNVKERLDFSCALLDRDGYLVVNAPHIPVHLGAMGSCVRSVLDWLKKDPADLHSQEQPTRSGSRNSSGENPPDLDLNLREGDILITNHPAYGGSHLPDVTVITPIFFEGERIGFAASRAHHSEIGGKRPGSMPPDAANLAEEGVIIPPSFIARGGMFNWTAIENLLRNSPWPSRSPDENMADLRAAVAANHRGSVELMKLAREFGSDSVQAYMQKLKSYAAGRLKSTLQKIPNGTYRAEESLDDGSLLSVRCEVAGESMKIDFTGTSGTHPGNLNANPSIVKSVVMYVLRLMVNEPLPLNDGLLDPVEIIIPEGMLNPLFSDDPDECPAVVGGNIETSQRLTDTLLKAFELAACSYGTMNNVLFGNESFGYYETVGGGTGAGDGFDGADAVHQHMTNTRAADPEILEHRYPVRLERYEIRTGSGGAGRWYGGNGITRELTFLEAVSLSVLTQHRTTAPYGMNGGKPGKTGSQTLVRISGEHQSLHWRDGAELSPGDRLILQTPGGGGFGKR